MIGDLGINLSALGIGAATAWAQPMAPGGGQSPAAGTPWSFSGASSYAAASSNGIGPFHSTGVTSSWFQPFAYFSGSDPDEPDDVRPKPSAAQNPTAPALSNLHRILGIDPVRDGAPFQMTPEYEALLKNNIIDEASIEVARRFFKELDPHVLGVLADKTAHTPHSIVFKDMSQFGYVLGFANSRMAKGVDPRIGWGDSVSMVVIRKTDAKPGERVFHGPPPGVLPHEWKHVVRYDELPAPFRVAYEDIRHDASIHQGYQSIFSNRIQEEFAARLAEIRLCEMFRLRTGKDMSEYVTEGVWYYRNCQAWAKQLESGDYEGLYEELRDDYQSYRAVSLYFAVLWRFGVEDIPEWEEVAKEMNGDDGRFSCSKMCQFLNARLRPLIEERIGSFNGLIGRLSNVGLSDVAFLLRVLAFTSNRMENNEAIGFYSTDFDRAVMMISRIVDGEFSDEHVAPRQGADLRLPVLEKPDYFRTGLRLPATKDALADEVVIAGTYMKLRFDDDMRDNAATLHYSKYMSLDGLASHLELAERSDPETAARIYSLILESRLDGHVMRWMVGVSLVKYGYRDQGMKMLRQVIDDRLTDYEIENHSRYLNSKGLRYGLFDMYVELARKNPKFEPELMEFIEAERGHVDRATAERMDEYLNAYNLTYYSKEYEEKLTRLLDRLAVYRQKYGQGLPEDALVDEYVIDGVRNDGEEDFGPEAEILTGRNYWVFASRTINNLLDKKSTYMLGLKFLERYPDCVAKLNLYLYAALKAPSDLDDSARLGLAMAYRNLLSRSGRVVWKWHLNHGNPDILYSASNKASYLEEIEGDAAPPGIAFMDTHFYASHLRWISGLLIDSKDESLRKKGRAVAIRGFSRSATQLPVQYRGFQRVSAESALYWRHFFISSFLDGMPEEEKRLLVDEALDFFESVQLGVDDKKWGSGNTDSVYDLKEMWRNFLFCMARGGLDAQIARARGIWDSHLKGVFEFSTGKEAVAGRTNDYFRNVVSFDLMLDCLQIIEAGGDGFDGLIDRLKNDRWRGGYNSDALIEVLKLFADKAVSSRVSDSADKIFALAKFAIDKRVLEHGDSSSSSYSPLIDALKKISLTDDMRDELFVHLIDQMTPEDMLFLSKDIESGVSGTVDAVQVLSFVLGNRATPKAEALLLQRIAGLASYVESVPSEYLPAVLRALHQIFLMLPGLVCASPEVQREMALFREDDEYRQALEWLGIYRNSETLFGEAMGRSELLEIIRGSDAARIRANAGRIKGEIIADAGTGMRSDDKSGLLNPAFEAWKRAKGSGDRELADALLDIWTDSPRSRHAEMKKDELYEALEIPGLALIEKRTIFENLAMTADVTAFVKKNWEMLVEDGDVRREETFYGFFRLNRERMGLEGRYKKAPRVPSNVLFSVIFSGTYEEAEALSASYMNLRRHYKPEGLDLNAYRPDLGNPFDILVLSDFVSLPHNFHGGYGFEGNMHVLFDLVAANGLGKAHQFAGSVKAQIALFDEIEAMAAKYFPSYRGAECLVEMRGLLANPNVRSDEALRERCGLCDHLMHDEWYGGYPDAVGYYRQPRYDERLYTAFETALRIYRRASSAERLTYVEMPPHLDGRHPLSQLLATDLFMKLPGGKQQVISKLMKEAARAEATRIFGEGTGLLKILQFFSYWPDVPPDEQANLIDLQASVVPSDRNVVVETITRSLKGNSELECILRNLGDRPIGVGTIADVYLSKLSDGTVVAVKVITPSKELEFRNGLASLEKMRDYLTAYIGFMDGVEDAIDLIDMYLDMVKSEFDLSFEARGANGLSNVLPRNIVVPHYFEEMTSEKVAVMGYIDGVPYDRRDPSHVELARELLWPMAYEQLRGERVGTFNLDIQPGNLMILPDGRIAILDFGQRIDLTPEDQALIKSLIDSYSGQMAAALTDGPVDPAAIRTVLEGMGTRRSASYDPAALDDDIAQRMASDGLGFDFRGISELIRMCRRRGLHIDVRFRKLVKGLATLDAAVTQRVNTEATGDDSFVRYDAESRAMLTAAINSGDFDTAKRIFGEGLDRLKEVNLIIGWQYAREELAEYVSSIMADTQPAGRAGFERMLAESLSEKGIIVNMENLLSGRYMPKKKQRKGPSDSTKSLEMLAFGTR